MILIDDRAGSGTDRKNKSGEFTDLINYKPLNKCQTCCKDFRIHNNRWLCSSGDISHSPLASLCRLGSADVCISGNGPSGPVLIGVEVKSIFDLISSLNSGRLQSSLSDAGQLASMQAEYDICWLLYYGTFRPSPVDGYLQIKKKLPGKSYPVWTDYLMGNRRVPYAYHESYLCSPSFINLDISSKHVASIEEAAVWISVLAKCWAKDYSKHKAARTFNHASDMTESGYRRAAGDNGSDAAARIGASCLPTPVDATRYQMAKTASSLPHMGFEKSTAASQHFDSIHAMITADSAEWEKIPGIGKVVASETVKAIHRKAR